MAPPLRFTSLDDFKVYASLEDASDIDPMLQSALAGAEEFVERYTRRRFAPDPPLDASGQDTRPSVLKKFTTRGRTVVRIPDLRVVDQNAGGVQFYGRKLLDNQYFLGFNAGGDQTPYGGTSTGDGDYAEPTTELTLGYGYGTGYGISGQFAFVLPLGYRQDDLWIYGRWGWFPTPPSVLDAVYSVAARRYRERDASWSDTVVTPDGGALSYFRQLPASVQAELDRFKVPNWGLI